MASKIERTCLPFNLDRRKKLSDKEKQRIKELYIQGDTQASLARQFGVSRRLIGIIVDPKKKEAMRDYAKKNWRNFQKDKNRNREAVQRTRDYKKQLHDDGLI